MIKLPRKSSPKGKNTVPAKNAAKAKADPSAKNISLSELFTLKEIAAHLKVCTKTARRIIEKKGIPYSLVGGQIRVPAEHLQLFMDKKW